MLGALLGRSVLGVTLDTSVSAVGALVMSGVGEGVSPKRAVRWPACHQTYENGQFNHLNARTVVDEEANTTVTEEIKRMHHCRCRATRICTSDRS